LLFNTNNYLIYLNYLFVNINLSLTYLNFNTIFDKFLLLQFIKLGSINGGNGENWSDYDINIVPLCIDFCGLSNKQFNLNLD